MSKVQTKSLVKKVHCNYIPVSNLEEASAWYEECLQLNRVKPSGEIMELGNGDWFFLIETKQQTNANFITDAWEDKDFEMFSLTFEVENCKALYDHLVNKGADIEPISDRGPCGLQFTFKDLDGNKFNVWQDTQ